MTNFQESGDRNLFAPKDPLGELQSNLYITGTLGTRGTGRSIKVAA